MAFRLTLNSVSPLLFSPANIVCFDRSIKSEITETDIYDAENSNDSSLNTESFSVSAKSTAPLQDQIVNTWIPLRKSLLESIVGNK